MRGCRLGMEELLRTLPEPMRVAMVLRYQEEMMPDEIARLLGKSVASVKSHLHQGLKLLRRKAACHHEGVCPWTSLRSS